MPYPVYPPVRSAELRSREKSFDTKKIRRLFVPRSQVKRVTAFLKAVGLGLSVEGDTTLTGLALRTASSFPMPSADVPAGGYAMEINAKGLCMLAVDDAGYSSGLQTLWQMAEAAQRLPAGCIRDWPRLRVRAFQIDTARQPESLAELKRLVRQQARYHYNECQLYLENSIKLPAFGEAADPDGLTVKEFQELVRYGQALGVELVPSLNLLGHMEKLLRHPDFKHLSENAAGWRHADQQSQGELCPTPPATRAFIAAVIEQICAISPSSKLMVGLDECWTIGSCPLCRARLDQNGYAGAIFADYIRFLHQEIVRHGKTMWMWEDMLFYHRDSIEHIPRDIGMNIWHYQHIEEYPSYSFQNWHRIDSMKELPGRGHPFMLCCGPKPTHIASMLRYAEGYPIDGILAVEWEGRDRVQELSHIPRVTVAAILWTGECADPADVARALLPSKSRDLPAAADALSWTEALRPSKTGGWCQSHVGPRYWSWPENADARLEREALLKLYDRIQPLPESFELQRTFLAADYVAIAFDCVREETALVGRAMLQNGLRKSEVLDRQVQRLRDVVALAASLRDKGRLYHRRYAARVAERPMVMAFSALPNASKELLAKLERFRAAPSPKTWPYHATSLHLDGWVLDPCAHRIALAVSKDGVTFEAVYAGGVDMSGGLQGAFSAAFPVKEVPRFVRLEVGGFSALAYRQVRVETLDGTRLPWRVVEAAGQVSHPEHLLEFDHKVAIFNEPDVMKNWLSLKPLPPNWVVLEF